MDAKYLLQRIADGAERCRSASYTGCVDRDVCTTILASLQDFMQARSSMYTPQRGCLRHTYCTGPAAMQTGLKGNRAVDADPLSVASAMTRAYPLLLGPCWTHSTHAQEGLPESADAALWFWLAQARWFFLVMFPWQLACFLLLAATTVMYYRHVYRPAQMAAW